MDVRRTPEERFADLAGFEHAPRSVEVAVEGTLRGGRTIADGGVPRLG
jgi:hypothetical protein